MADPTTLDRLRDLFTEQFGPSAMEHADNNKFWRVTVDAPVKNIDMLDIGVAIEAQFGVNTPLVLLQDATLTSLAAYIDTMKSSGRAA